MKFFLILLVLLFKFQSSEAANEIKCNTNALKSLNGVDYFPTAEVEIDATFRINCKNGFSFKDKDGSMNRSFLVRCTPSGIFAGIKSCAPDITETCDTDQLRREPNLDYYWSKLIPVDTPLKLTCRKSWGIENGDIMERGYNVMCDRNGKFTGLKKCIPAVDVSGAVKSGLKINMAVFTVGPQGGKGNLISSDNIIKTGQKIKIECLPRHYIKDLSTPGSPEVTSYIYGGGNDKIYSCSPKELIVPITPPSSPEGPFTPKLNCNSNNIIIPNGKITAIESAPSSSRSVRSNPAGAPPSSSVSAGKKVTITCQVPFAVTDGVSSAVGPQLSNKFDVTCDPDGSGKFLGIKYCGERCDARALKETAKGKVPNKNDNAVSHIVNIVAPIPNKPSTVNSYLVLGTVSQKNTLHSFEYVEQGQSVAVMCAPGYEIRKTGEKGFVSNCTSVGFDNKQEVCETEIKPCENRDITVNGILDSAKLIASGREDSPTLKGETLVGNRLKVECRGGAKYRTGRTKTQGAPKCVYKPLTGKSEWEGATFDCFDGCIGPGGDDTSGVPTAPAMTASFTTTVRPVHVVADCINPNSGGPHVGFNEILGSSDVVPRGKPWFQFMANLVTGGDDFWGAVMFQACSFKGTEASVLRQFLSSNMPFRQFNTSDFRYQAFPTSKVLYMHAEQLAQIRYCPVRQKSLIAINIIQDALHSGMFNGNIDKFTTFLNQPFEGNIKMSHCTASFDAKEGQKQYGNSCQTELITGYKAPQDHALTTAETNTVTTLINMNDISQVGQNDSGVKDACASAIRYLFGAKTFKWHGGDSGYSSRACWGVQSLRIGDFTGCSYMNSVWQKNAYVKTTCEINGVHVLFGNSYLNPTFDNVHVNRI